MDAKTTKNRNKAMTTIEPDILEIISDMENFISENWENFKSNMIEKGFTDEDIEAMGEKLTEFLEDEGMR